MNKPYISIEEAIKRQGENTRSCKLLTSDNGCVNGCCSGITLYTELEFSEKCGCHNDQEGFYVLEGEGYVKLDDEIIAIKQGDSFIALPGVKHTVKRNATCDYVKVFWFHSAI